MFEEYVTSAARTLWVLGWADESERRGESFSGCDLMDVAPPTPDDYRLEAARLLGHIEATIPRGSLIAFEAFMTELNPENPPDRDTIAYYLIMQALGHGVGLFDSYNVPETLDRALRHVECSLWAAHYMDPPDNGEDE